VLTAEQLPPCRHVYRTLRMRLSSEATPAGSSIRALNSPHGSTEAMSFGAMCVLAVASCAARLLSAWVMCLVSSVATAPGSMTMTRMSGYPLGRSRRARPQRRRQALLPPVVGELSLSFNRLELAADQGLALCTYAAEPGSRSEEALRAKGQPRPLSGSSVRCPGGGLMSPPGSLPRARKRTSAVSAGRAWCG
jgi:hypothetical protein